RVIAQLIKDGRYSAPKLLDGMYAAFREAIKLRYQLTKQLTSIDGRVQNNLQRYFPKFQDVFKDWSGKAALCTLRTFPFPSDIREMTPEEVLAQWKTAIKGGVGIKRAITLVEKANKSIGVDVG